MKIPTKAIFVFIFFIFFNANFLLPQTPLNKKAEINEIEESWLKQIQNPKNEKSEENQKESETITKENLFGEPPSFVSLFSRFTLVLFLSAGFVYFLIQYFKKKNLIINQNISPIKILGSIPLMAGKYLQIVDISGQIVILGISENNIQLIQIVENSRIAEKLRLWYEENEKKIRQSQWNFSRIMNKIFGNPFSFWHENSKDQRNFYTELKERNSEDIYLEDLEELFKFQKEKLKKLKE
ncbi:MAG: flagellar biosynthetic protein FliO [Leptonema sp. (in: bacteria)]